MDTSLHSVKHGILHAWGALVKAHMLSRPIVAHTLATYICPPRTNGDYYLSNHPKVTWNQSMV